MTHSADDKRARFAEAARTNPQGDSMPKERKVRIVIEAETSLSLKRLRDICYAETGDSGMDGILQSATYDPDDDDTEHRILSVTAEEVAMPDARPPSLVAAVCEFHSLNAIPFVGMAPDSQVSVNHSSLMKLLGSLAAHDAAPPPSNAVGSIGKALATLATLSDEEHDYGRIVRHARDELKRLAALEQPGSPPAAGKTRPVFEEDLLVASLGHDAPAPPPVARQPGYGRPSDSWVAHEFLSQAEPPAPPPGQAEADCEGRAALRAKDTGQAAPNSGTGD